MISQEGPDQVISLVLVERWSMAGAMECHGGPWRAMECHGVPGAKYCRAGDGRGGAERKQVKVKQGSEGVSARVYEDEGLA